MQTIELNGLGWFLFTVCLFALIYWGFKLKKALPKITKKETVEKPKFITNCTSYIVHEFTINSQNLTIKQRFEKAVQTKLMDIQLKFIKNDAEGFHYRAETINAAALINFN